MKIEELNLNMIEIADNLYEGIYFVNMERNILFWNKMAEKITGYNASEMVGKSCKDGNLNPIDIEGNSLCLGKCPILKTIMDGKQRKDHVYIKHKSGYRMTLFVNCIPIFKDGAMIGVMEVFVQNPQTVYEEDLVDHLSGIAIHDTLTGFPNRRYIDSFLSYQFDLYKRSKKLFAVLFADIDDLSRINNQYGHEAGDLLLTNISESIRRNIRKDDFIGRWAGEEFLGIYAITNSGDISIVAEKFRQIVKNTDVYYKNQILNVSVSVGITFVKDIDTPKTIVDRAHVLMYKSKEMGKNRVSIG